MVRKLSLLTFVGGRQQKLLIFSGDNLSKNIRFKAVFGKIVDMLVYSYVVTVICMKYQQLENLECGWKWAYLVKNIAKVN